ncbi:DUF2933 domain-containing protein [Castellaniella sp. FW104-16D08]
MAWLTENWIWVLFGVAFIAMHLFGHGCHGGHGGDHSSSSREDRVTNRISDKKAEENPPEATGSSRKPHRH